MKRHFKLGWVLVASLVVAAAAAPVGAAPASAESSTVLVAEQTHTTSSPACSFTLRVTETLSGASVTGLHNHVSFSCVGLGSGNRYLGTGIGDSHMHYAGVGPSGPYAQPGLGFSVAYIDHKIANTDSSAVADLDYNNVKATHPYGSGFSFMAYLPDGVTADQSQDCNQYGTFWACGFETQTTPASAPNVGPDPVPGPVTRTLTILYDTSGGTCQLITELRAADPTTLSYTGRTVCPSTYPIASGGGDIFVYGDRREVTQLGDATDEECYQCPDMSLSGKIPAVKGRTYTATFYILINVVGPPPPECSGDSESGYTCEVSASVVF